MTDSSDRERDREREAGAVIEIRDWLADHGSALQRTLEDLSSIDAPTGDPEQLDATAALLIDCVSGLGGSITTHPTPAGTHIEARFGPEGARPILIVAHYDTVWPRGTAAARPLDMRDGRAFGPGVFDMRGGLAAALVALECLIALRLLERPAVLLLTADEESGSGTSRSLIERLGRDAVAAFVPEPPLPGGALKTARRGSHTYRLETSGREAHAGLAPERGVSAIHELIAFLAAAEGLANPAVGTNINVGVIGGGSRSNVIPGSAFAEVDVRVSSVDEANRVDQALSELALAPSHPEARRTIASVHQRPPMERTAAIAQALGRVREIARLVDITIEEGSAGGGSDGSFLAPLGVPVLDGLGPEGDGAHAVDEYVELRSLEERTFLLALLTLLF